MNKAVDDFLIGPRLRRLRIGRGLSQRELARRAGVSNATISMIEADRVSPSVSALRQVLSALDVGVADFFADAEAPAEQVVYRAARADRDRRRRRLLPAGRHRTCKGRALQMIHERYRPGAQSGAKMLSHQGEEAGLVIKGLLGLEVDGRRYELKPGDAYVFDSRKPHAFRNIGGEDLIVVSACTPPTF